MMDTAIRLEDLQIASPCGVSWDDMNRVGEGERVRHCDHCTLNVYNIEAMTREEAVALIREHEGERVCVRMMQRDDGTVITADCPVGVSRVQRRVRRMVAGLAALFGLTGVTAAMHSWASRAGLEPAVASKPFSLISEKVFGRKAPPPAPVPPAIAGRVVLLGSVCFDPVTPAPTPSSPPITPLTVDGADIPWEPLP